MDPSSTKHSFLSYRSHHTTTNQAIPSCFALCIMAGYEERTHKAYSSVKPQPEMAKQVSEGESVGIGNLEQW